MTSGPAPPRSPSDTTGGHPGWPAGSLASTGNTGNTSRARSGRSVSHRAKVVGGALRNSRTRRRYRRCRRTAQTAGPPRLDEGFVNGMHRWCCRRRRPDPRTARRRPVQQAWTFADVREPVGRGHAPRAGPGYQRLPGAAVGQGRVPENHVKEGLPHASHPCSALTGTRATAEPQRPRVEAGGGLSRGQSSDLVGGQGRTVAGEREQPPRANGRVGVGHAHHASHDRTGRGRRGGPQRPGTWREANGGARDSEPRDGTDPKAAGVQQVKRPRPRPRPGGVVGDPVPW